MLLKGTVNMFLLTLVEIFMFSEVFFILQYVSIFTPSVANVDMFHGSCAKLT